MKYPPNISTFKLALDVTKLMQYIKKVKNLMEQNFNHFNAK